MHMKLKLKVFIFFLFISLSGFAQQYPQFSQYMVNKFLYNPAFAGYEDYVDLKAGYRSQWLGLGIPNNSFYLTAHGAIDKTDHTSDGPTPNISKTIRHPYSPTRIRPNTHKSPFHQGFGAQLLADKFGQIETINVGLSYAYHLSLGGEKKFSIGTTFGFGQVLLDNTGGLFNYISPNGIDFNNNQIYNDPILMVNSRVKGNQSVVNLGALYYTRNYYIGFSSIWPILNTVNYSLGKSAPAEANAPYGELNKLYAVQIGIIKRISDDIKLYPAALVKYSSLGNIVPELNMRVNYQDLVWAGTSYRHKESIGLMAGMNLSNKMNFSYSIDLSKNNPIRENLISHELIIGILLRGRFMPKNTLYN